MDSVCGTGEFGRVRYSFVGQGNEYEARRQIVILEDGGTIAQETRLFDPNKARPVPCASGKRRTATAISPILLPLEFDQPRQSRREAAASFAVLLMGLHLAGVFVASVEHRDNRVTAMITGRKRRD